MAQQVPIGQKRSMPAHVYQLATEQRVGTPVARYSSRFLTRFLFGMVVGALGLYPVLFSFLGRFSVSSQGIHIGSRQETIAWNELNMVRESGSHIYINWKKQGHLLFSTRTIPLAEIPNVCVLTELVKTIRGHT